MNNKVSEDQLQAAIEALLFVSPQGVSALKLAEILQIDVSRVTSELDALSHSLSEQNRGIQLREVAGAWRLYTHPTFHELLEEYAISWDTSKLSSAMIETLAIVAYGQPCTRAYVATTRGVSSESSISSLVSKGLLKEAGTADVPGNPTLYATTSKFLEKFGLKSIKDLPPLEDFAPDQKTKDLISERLSAHKISQEEADEALVGVGGAQAREGDARACAQNGVGGAQADKDGAQPPAQNDKGDAQTRVQNDASAPISVQNFTFDVEDEDEIIEGLSDYV